MATQVKFEKFSEDKLSAVHNLDGSTHVLKLALSDTAPSASADSVFADITEIAAGNGYTAGGITLSYSRSRTGGTTKITVTDTSITASGGSIGPFRYFIIYNATATNSPLISFVDRGSSITLNDGDTENIDFDDANGLFDET